MKKFQVSHQKLKIIIFVLSGILAQEAIAQNKLFLNPVQYTERQLEVYGSTCNLASQIHVFINGKEVPASALKTKYIIFGYYAFEMNFGLMVPGDIFRVTDDCGSTAAQRTVTDDYVYVQVPNGTAFTGNGIAANDEYAPYPKLSSPVKIDRCTSVMANSHGLITYYVFSPNTNGRFAVNNVPLTDKASALNPQGYDINFNGYQGTPAYSVNADGSITSNTAVKLESNTHFSGTVPIEVSYLHQGQFLGTDLSFGFNAMSIRHVSINSFEIEKASLGGNFTVTQYSSTPSSLFKVTYDGVYYRAYRDGVLIDELRRFVEYSASSGILTPSSASGLNYATPVSWSEMQSGPQWISVLVDGVLYTRQLFQVAPDANRTIVLTKTN